MAKGNENVLGVSIGKGLIDRLKKQAVRETAKHERPVTVTEIVKDAVEEYLGYWETGIDAAEFHKAGTDDPADPGKQLRDLVQDCVSPEAAAVTVKAVPRTPMSAVSVWTRTLWLFESLAHFRETEPIIRPTVVCCFPPAFPISSENLVRGATFTVAAGASGEVICSSTSPSAPVTSRSKFWRASPSFTRFASRVSSSRTISTAPST